MANRLKDFSLDGLREMCKGNFLDDIVNYNRTDYSYGCTVVSYNKYTRGSTHLKVAALSYGALLPVTLCVDVLARLLQEKRFRYFHTEDGVYLGSTTNEATNSANILGERKMREKQYERARSYFNIAFHLCNDSRKKDFKRKRDTVDNEMEKVREQEEKERVQKARNNYEEGLLLLNEAFSLENSDEATEANTKFHMSKNSFLAAAELAPNNTQYNNWLQVSNLKIEGDALFNDGMTLEEEGRRLCETQKYEEALAKYREAKTKYAEGLSRSKDSRFEACIDVVNELERIILGESMRALLPRMEVKESSGRQSGTAKQLHRNTTSHCVIDS